MRQLHLPQRRGQWYALHSRSLVLGERRAKLNGELARENSHDPSMNSHHRRLAAKPEALQVGRQKRPREQRASRSSAANSSPLPLSIPWSQRERLTPSLVANQEMNYSTAGDGESFHSDRRQKPQYFLQPVRCL